MEIYRHYLLFGCLISFTLSHLQTLNNMLIWLELQLTTSRLLAQQLATWKLFDSQLTGSHFRINSQSRNGQARIFGSLNCEPSKRVLFSSNPNLKNLRSNSIKIGANSKEQLLKKIIKKFFLIKGFCTFSIDNNIISEISQKIKTIKIHKYSFFKTVYYIMLKLKKLKYVIAIWRFNYFCTASHSAVLFT